MDRSWIDIPDKLSLDYANGIIEFISVAEKRVNAKGMVLCPCCRCMNKKLQNINMIKVHLLSNGFLDTYKRWYYHGEQIDEVEDEMFINNEDAYVNDKHNDLAEGLHDAIGSKYFNIGPTSDFVDQTLFNVDDKYDTLFKSLHQPLYGNCKDFLLLSTMVKLMNIKVLNKLTDKAFDDILKLLREILPDGNHCPENYQQTRKLLCEVGLGYEQIDVCQYDCVIFYGENANSLACPVCKSIRYVRNKIPHKRLRWFPIKDRLKRLFSSKRGKAWKHFDSVYLNFALDSRTVRMGLASDGFNPFSNMTSTYSIRWIHTYVNSYKSTTHYMFCIYKKITKVSNCVKICIY
ncbi:uncharacterized protein LOC141660647 [Apium graveolens]|uniref:uncharacterized protein LOC141660647 n=1 Tax=Apium graveolens TaxID=4045 RepID=UPI003D799F8A